MRKLQVTHFILLTTATILFTGCSQPVDNPEPAENQQAESEDPRGEYIYRIVVRPDGTHYVIQDDAEDMDQYPEGADFNSLEEADAYIRKLNRGKAEYL